MQTGSCRRNPEVEGPFVCWRPLPSVWRHVLDHLCPCVIVDNSSVRFHHGPVVGVRSIDFMMAYTQADMKTDIFMQLPAGTTIKEVDPNKHLLKLQKNLYGLKDSQVTWHEHIKASLLSREF